MRWIWDLTAPPAQAKSLEPIEIKLIPVRGLTLAANVMARAWKGYHTPAGAISYLQRIPKAFETLPFVAYRRGEPIGSCIALVEGSVAELYDGIHVLPDFRGRRVGTELLLYVLKYLRDKGVRQAFVVRRIRQPATEDDVAASRLYDRAGGIRRNPLVEVLYTPQCPFSALWLALAEEWLYDFEVEVRRISMWDDYRQAEKLLIGSSLGTLTDRGLALNENVFLRIFVDGLLVEGEVPPSREQVVSSVERMGGLRKQASTEDSVTTANGLFPAGVEEVNRGFEPGSLSLVPLERGRAPGGIPTCLRLHAPSLAEDSPSWLEGCSMKERWLEQIWEEVPVCGLVAMDGDRPVGAIEYLPRRLARRAGYVTGQWGDDGEVLTVTCIESARYWPRQAMMEYLLQGLLDHLARDAGGARFLEACGCYQQPQGPSPYWLFDKFGFERREERVPGKAVILSYPVAGK